MLLSTRRECSVWHGARFGGAMDEGLCREALPSKCTEHLEMANSVLVWSCVDEFAQAVYR
jgi:hypothetical protein